MTRRNTMLRLHKNLLARRQRLDKKLAGELAHLHNCNATEASGDSADLAFDAGSDEMSSLLAELDNRELSQIDRALAHWNQGTYGICECCQKAISLARLQALPYAPFCISCVREMEKSPHAQARQRTGDWGRISDAQALMQDQRINLSKLEREMSEDQRA